MNTIEDRLGTLEQAAKDPPRTTEAEEGLHELLVTLRVDEVRAYADRLREVIAAFFPKRRKRLLETLDHRLSQKQEVARPAAAPAPRLNADENLRLFVRDNLRRLSTERLFQWDSDYAPFFHEVFTRYVDGIGQEAELQGNAEAHRALFAKHAREVFEKGFRFKAEQGIGAFTALDISLGGLRQFLLLPFEIYLDSVRTLNSARRLLASRYFVSASLAGILGGYSEAAFGDATGKGVLHGKRFWLKYLAFLRSSDLEFLATRLEGDELLATAMRGLQPVAAALDRLATTATASLLPTFAELKDHESLLEIFLESWPESGRREVGMDLRPDGIPLEVFRQFARRRPALLIATFPPEVRRLAEGDADLRRALVPLPSSPAEMPVATNLCLQLLSPAEKGAARGRQAHAPLEVNWAESFPVESVYLDKYYRVERKSIREQVRTLSHRNGVSLWCSVRRSGKTTACFDLPGSESGATLIKQSCAQTAYSDNATALSDAVQAALEEQTSLPRSFLVDVLSTIAPEYGAKGRAILMLDEYESLFERLDAEVRRDEGTRHRVALRLLDQLVSFSRDNLLVLLGQRPDAHFVLMEQNQLSPYVRQEPFPLFAFGGPDGESEFEQLLQKILTERLPFNRAFAEMVFEEVGGHPFLTVKLMVAFLDWLIERRQVIRGGGLPPETFGEFEESALTPRAVALCKQFDFFRKMAKEALSEGARKRTPWLYAVMATVRALGRWETSSVCSVGEFEAIVRSLHIEADTGLTAYDLLRDAPAANFLSVRNDCVGPRIRLLARIAATVSPPRGVL